MQALLRRGTKAKIRTAPALTSTAFLGLKYPVFETKTKLTDQSMTHKVFQSTPMSQNQDTQNGGESDKTDTFTLQFVGISTPTPNLTWVEEGTSPFAAVSGDMPPEEQASGGL